MIGDLNGNKSKMELTRPGSRPSTSLRATLEATDAPPHPTTDRSSHSDTTQAVNPNSGSSRVPIARGGATENRLRRQASQRSGTEKNSPVSVKGETEAVPATSAESQSSKLWKARTPLQIDAIQVIDTEDHPFTTGMLVDVSSIVKKLPLKSLTERGRTEATSYYVKPTVGQNSSQLKHMVRYNKVHFIGGDPKNAERLPALVKLHYALADVTAGLAYQRFFGDDFSPKSRLFKSATGELKVGLKIQPNFQDFSKIEKKIGTFPIEPWNKDWRPDDTSWHRPTVSIQKGGAAVLPPNIAGSNKDSNDVEFDYSNMEVVDLGKLAAATWFLAERDTNSGNFGVVATDNRNTVRIVKIDHGSSLSFESTPGSITRNNEKLDVPPEKMLTPENLKVRLEDVGGDFSVESKPFKEFVATVRKIADMTDDHLTAHIDDIVGVYKPIHEQDENILESDLRARLQERLDFARQAINKYDAGTLS
ncbi:hypothetical protein [Actimicrobium sp. CCI2.3]|uniref:hypothetical protein n=1 Tax=Actimicrobium sp. CCI2.3 TaxID=3048616 RepID=UPI002AB39F60|nr:hypothetical protein [Actimicrobium sp. CCI2.3]MDY7573035.1 hypothetical protein [Actimicrobium sp. CCI2.3]MEB0020832.1 hypothetical protein [Actimicrobium sp. CCI2.3]